MALITTRVRIPYKDDCRKLRQVLQYIRSTIHIPLIIRAYKMNIVKWWVDASYAMHPYCWSHTSVIISLVWGLVGSMYKRQNINSRISTEAELIGADGVIPSFL